MNTFLCLFLCAVVTGEVKNVPATEGKSVILRADLTKIEKDDTIQWYYEDEDNRIAEFKAGDRSPDTFPGADGRFRGKLNLDKTGDLSITDIRTIYSGLYILKLSNSRRTKYKRFSVSVKREFIKSLCVLMVVRCVNNLDDQK